MQFLPIRPIEDGSGYNYTPDVDTLSALLSASVEAPDPVPMPDMMQVARDTAALSREMYMDEELYQTSKARARDFADFQFTDDVRRSQYDRAMDPGAQSRAMQQVAVDAAYQRMAEPKGQRSTITQVIPNANASGMGSGMSIPTPKQYVQGRRADGGGNMLLHEQKMEARRQRDFARDEADKDRRLNAMFGRLDYDLGRRQQSVQQADMATQSMDRLINNYMSASRGF